MKPGNDAKLTIWMSACLLLCGCTGPKRAATESGLTGELREHDRALGELERARAQEAVERQQTRPLKGR
jgi:hypothetical protein